MTPKMRSDDDAEPFVLGSSSFAKSHQKIELLSAAAGSDLGERDEGGCVRDERKKVRMMEGERQRDEGDDDEPDEEASDG